jgi:hypothetical protein
VNDAKHRNSTLTLVMIAGLSLAIVFVLAFPHGRNSRTEARALERECNEEAVEFRGDLTRLAGEGAIVAYTSHFNQQRRQCLVEITSNRPEDSQMSVYDQIFVASRTRPSRARHTSVGAIVMALLSRRNRRLLPKPGSTT